MAAADDLEARAPLGIVDGVHDVLERLRIDHGTQKIAEVEWRPHAEAAHRLFEPWRTSGQSERGM